MATTYRFPDADDSKSAAPVGLLQRSLSAPTQPPPGVEANDNHFFAAVMAAGGNVARSVSVSEFAKSGSNGSQLNGGSGAHGNNIGVSASSLNNLSAGIHIPSDADTSLNEDLFFPSVSAAAAVTLSPSFGPTSSNGNGGENLFYSQYGGSAWGGMAQQQPLKGQQQRGPGGGMKEEMPALGLPMSASSDLPPSAMTRSSSGDYRLRLNGPSASSSISQSGGESQDEYQLRAAMAGMQLGSSTTRSSTGSSLTASAAVYDPTQLMQQSAAMYYATPEAYGSMYANGAGQYIQTQAYGRYQGAEMYGATPSGQQQHGTRMGMATASLAPVMDQRYAAAGYSNATAAQYAAMQQMPDYGQAAAAQQPRMMGYTGMGRGMMSGSNGGTMPYGKPQQQQHQQGNGRRSYQQQHQHQGSMGGQHGMGQGGSMSKWNQQQTGAGSYMEDEMFQTGGGMMPQGGGSGSTRQPRSSILDDLRAAMRASSANTRHRVVMNNTAPNGFTRPPANGMFIAPQHQQQGNGVNNAQMMQAAPMSIPYTLADVRGHAVELAQDQFGSRWLQQQLSSSTVPAQDKQALFMELLPAAKELASDTFGNYCVQILLNPAVGTPEQQRALCESAFEGNMLELSRNTYACRCIQSLIKLFQLGDEIIPIVRQDRMLRELESDILGLVTDSNANHVAQQIIERIRPIERISFVLQAFKGNYVTLAKDPYGCRVCQRVLEHATPEYVEPALEELLDAIDDLVTDSMGNYVVQHIITASGDKYGPQKARLVEAVKKKLLMFATHKFASNVVEKVLEYGDGPTRRAIIGLMLDAQTPLGNGGPMVPLLQVMMSDLFANYVCQRSLAVADRDQLIRLVAIVRGSAQELRRMTYGKHILSACEKAAAAAGIP